MPTKKPKRMAKAKIKAKGFNGFTKKNDKPLPDTSRIPWFQPMPKNTGRLQDDSGRKRH